MGRTQGPATERSTLPTLYLKQEPKEPTESKGREQSSMSSRRDGP